MMLKLPPNQTTMIGSLPHDCPSEAFRLLTEYPLSIPAWPQFPQRAFTETMIPQYSEGFPGIQINPEHRKIWLNRDEDLPNKMAEFYDHVINQYLDPFAISKDYAVGLHFFLNQLENTHKHLPFIKGQITGPFTFALGVNDQEKRPVWFDDQYRDVVLQGLGMKARWQMGELGKYADYVLLFLDEPILSALGTPAYMAIDHNQVLHGLNEVIHAAHEGDAFVGVHCCGNMDWGLLAQTDVNIIAFDAYYYGDKIALYPEPINTFLERDGILAFGIVPTLEPDILAKETVESLQAKVESLLELFIRKGISEDRLRQQILFTPSCGMGSLTHEPTQQVLELLLKISCWE